MKFTVKKEILLQGLNIVKGTFGNNNFPALNNIYFEATNSGDVVIKASNAHETTKTVIQAFVEDPGKVLIDGFTISKVVQTFADGDIVIEQQAGSLNVDVLHPKGELEIMGCDPDDFVNPAEVSEQSSFMIPSNELKDAFNLVSFARASNHSKAILNGIAMIVDNGRTTLVASDSTRVARYVFDTPNATDINVVLGPEVAKGLNAIKGNVAVRLGDTGILIETNDSSYQDTILATGFPRAVNNYFLLPEAASSIIPREAIKETLTRVSVVSKAGKDDPYAEFEFKSSGELEIKFKGSRGRIKSEKMQITHNGADVTLKLSVDKILEAVNKIDKDNVEFSFPQGKGAVKAVNIYPEGNRDYGIFNMGVGS